MRGRPQHIEATNALGSPTKNGHNFSSEKLFKDSHESVCLLNFLCYEFFTPPLTQSKEFLLGVKNIRT
jgi:hypothetical protein